MRPVPLFNEVFLSGPANVFAREWRTVLGNNANPQITTIRSGVALLPKQALATVQPYHVSIYPKYETYKPFDASDPNFYFDVQNNQRVTGSRQIAWPTTILKARFSVDMGAVGDMQVDFDIGAGVDFITPPCQSIQVDLLEPDDRTLPPAVPPGINPGARYVASIAVRATCTPYEQERDHNMVYTQSVYTGSGNGALQEVKRVPNAKRVQVFSDDTWTTQVNMRTSLRPPNTPRGGAEDLGEIFQGAIQPEYPGGLSSRRLDIPDGANIFTINRQTNAQIFTIVQELAF